MLPLIYNYVQTLQTHMLNEMDFCRVTFIFFWLKFSYRFQTKSRDLWVEVVSVDGAFGRGKRTIRSGDRAKREWSFGQFFERSQRGLLGIDCSFMRILNFSNWIRVWKFWWLRYLSTGPYGPSYLRRLQSSCRWRISAGFMYVLKC